MKRLLALVSATWLLSGCATRPDAEVRAAWYLQHASAAQPARQTPELYLALLNAGSLPLAIRSVSLNGGDAQQPDGWQWGAQPGKASAFVFEPGRLVTLPASEFWRTGAGQPESFDRPCQLPVDVKLWLAGAAVGSAMVRAKLLGQLPSSLPLGWEKACRPSPP